MRLSCGGACAFDSNTFLAGLLVTARLASIHLSQSISRAMGSRRPSGRRSVPRRRCMLAMESAVILESATLSEPFAFDQAGNLYSINVKLMVDNECNITTSLPGQSLRRYSPAAGT